MSQDKTGYQKMLSDLNCSEDKMQSVTNMLEVISLYNPHVEKKKSDIHGYGMFARKTIKKNTIIGLGTINGIYKTNIGRYTNHSSNPNIEFKFLNNEDAIAIASKDIKKNKEILVDYKNHILNHRYYERDK
tara:strand:+ start:1291 stop:1683 length:393 start_codon:yes stop_codon:yes gene_type:complete